MKYLIQKSKCTKRNSKLFDFERENILTPSTLLAPSTVIFLKLFFPKKLAPSFRKKMLDESKIVN